MTKEFHKRHWNELNVAERKTLLNTFTLDAPVESYATSEWDFLPYVVRRTFIYHAFNQPFIAQKFGE